MSKTNEILGAVLNVLRANDISNAGVKIDAATGRVTLLKGVGKVETESFVFPEGDPEALEALILSRML
jgi:hypothetical protein